METAQIDGATRLYAIIGDPISSVLSPGVFNALFSRQNVIAVLLPLHVAAADVQKAWAGLLATRNCAGLIVTMPHKRDVRAGRPTECHGHPGRRHQRRAPTP